MKIEKGNQEQPVIDIKGEMEVISLNKLVFETQILQQQVIAGQLELRAAKVNQLQQLLSHVQNDELKNKITDEISKLLSEIISIKVS
jgi:hypothetical protein